jgi:hypothetical protein
MHTQETSVLKKTYMLADVAEEMKGLSMRTFDDYGVHWRNFCHR